MLILPPWEGGRGGGYPGLKNTPPGRVLPTIATAKAVKAMRVIAPFDSAQGAMTFFALATAISMSQTNDSASISFKQTPPSIPAIPAARC